MSENILEVRHLKKYFPTKRGLLHAVDDVNFSIKKGTTMGLVGESGCGKSTVGRLILRLTEATDGEILFYDDDIRKYDREKMRHARRRLQIVFQDPYASLDGRKSIFESIAEPLQVQKYIKTKKKWKKKFTSSWPLPVLPGALPIHILMNWTAAEDSVLELRGPWP